MANVTMPTPVALAGGGLCLLAGYLVGVVAGPDTSDADTATVVSYDGADGELCLTGEAVAEERDTVDGVLCGQWQRLDDSDPPEEGDLFRFATIASDPGDDPGDDSGDDSGDDGGDEREVTTLIYGDVVR